MRHAGVFATLLGAALMLSTLPASAQGPRKGGGDKAMFRTAMMQEKLGLSDPQADRVYEILSQARQGQNCRTLSSYTEKRDCMKSKREGVRQQLSGVLTADQLSQLDELREKRKNRRHKRRSGQRNGSGYRH